MQENVGFNDGNKRKKTRKFKFNALDLIIILIILAVAAAGYYIFSGWMRGAGESELTLEYTVEIRGILDELADRIAVGDEVIDSVSKKSLGRVAAVRNIPYTEPVYIEDADLLVMTAYPARSNILITISADAALDEIGYKVDDYRVTVGTPFYLRLPDFVCSGFCIDIMPIEKTNG